MALQGGCYCGALRYEASGEPAMKAQCHCRECAHHTGGAPNLLMAMPLDQFRYTKGTPKTFTRSDIDSPVSRNFCETCGVQIGTPIPSMGVFALKVGTLDDPSVFSGPELAIFTCDKLPYQLIADGVAAFDKLPG